MPPMLDTTDTHEATGTHDVDARDTDARDAAAEAVSAAKADAGVDRAIAVHFLPHGWTVEDLIEFAADRMAIQAE